MFLNDAFLLDCMFECFLSAMMTSSTGSFQNAEQIPRGLPMSKLIKHSTPACAKLLTLYILWIAML